MWWQQNEINSKQVSPAKKVKVFIAQNSWKTQNEEKRNGTNGRSVVMSFKQDKKLWKFQSLDNRVKYKFTHYDLCWM